MGDVLYLMLPPLLHYLYNNKDRWQFETIEKLYSKLTDVRRRIQDIKLQCTNDPDLFLNDQTDRFASYKFVTEDSSDFFKQIGDFTNNDPETINPVLEVFNTSESRIPVCL